MGGFELIPGYILHFQPPGMASVMPRTENHW
jgi:hypothetical protein